MNIQSEIQRYVIKILVLLIPLTAVSNSYADEQSTKEVISPIRINTDMVSGLGLKVAPWDDATRLAKWSFLFTGEELSVSIFESTPKKTGEVGHVKNRVRNYPYDQFVVVLSGKSVLTDAAGNAQSLTAGDYFVVPRGFDGTWEDFGVYRELIVILEEAVRTRKLEIERVE